MEFPKPRWPDRLRWSYWTGSRYRGWLAALLLTGGAVSIVAAGWLAQYAGTIEKLARGAGDTTFYGADGTPWFRLDERRHDVGLEHVSQPLQQAVIAVEDRRFYWHPGIDPLGIARAALRDLRSGRRAEGGSTITQQLARTLFLSQTKTFGRKVKEAGIALLLEAKLTKAEILELYLNRIYLSGGVYGVESMSRLLFSKPAREVTLPEATLIAGLIRAPSALSPWNNYEAALARSRLVLDHMRDVGYISDAEATAAKTVRPKIVPYRGPTDPRTAWAKDYLRQEFRNRFGGDQPLGWQVHTSFVPALQDAAERVVSRGIARLGPAGLQAALVALDPASGNVLALVGGTNYLKSTYNRAVRARRQPGSAFKPLVFAAALSHGFSPVSLLTNLDQAGAADDPAWRPASVTDANSEKPMTTATLRTALAQSNNAAAVILQERLGVHEIIRVARAAGLPELPAVPSLALGSGEVTPLELTAAYTMFPNKGQVVRPRSLVAIQDEAGALLYSEPIASRQVLSPAVAFQMVSMLRGVVDEGTGSPARRLGVAGAVAGKTGTTDRYIDAWFVGFSSSMVVGVWVGRDTPAPIGAEAYAARIALPIWAEFMKTAATRRPARPFERPAGLRGIELCRVSHLRPVDDCPVYTEFFKASDEIPEERCREHDRSFGEDAGRAIGGFFRGLGQRLRGIFRE